MRATTDPQTANAAAPEASAGDSNSAKAFSWIAFIAVIPFSPLDWYCRSGLERDVGLVSASPSDRDHSEKN